MSEQYMSQLSKTTILPKQPFSNYLCVYFSQSNSWWIIGLLHRLRHRLRLCCRLYQSCHHLAVYIAIIYIPPSEMHLDIFQKIDREMEIVI